MNNSPTNHRSPAIAERPTWELGTARTPLGSPCEVQTAVSLLPYSGCFAALPTSVSPYHAGRVLHTSKKLTTTRYMKRDSLKAF